MTDTTHIPDPDDEPIFTTPHRELIRQFGRLAAAEQERLERESRLLRRQIPG
jgi:hypothetical protein